MDYMANDEQQIRQLVATWIAATKAGDHDRVLSLMTDDVVFLVPGQAPMIGKAAFASAMQGPGQARPEFDGNSDIQEIQVTGDWAFMWTKLTVRITPQVGATITRAGHTLSILKKENGKWLLARDANMLTTLPAN
jgi:uncharacterized protein (TIGR02246 family)